MRKTILISMLLSSVCSFSQTLPNEPMENQVNTIFKSKKNKVELLNKGNQYYKNEEYSKAEECYLGSLNEDEKYYKANINMAHALLKQAITDKDVDKLNQSELLYKKSIDLSKTKKEKAISYSNLGNSQLINQKIKESIESYKNSLRLVPENQEIKHNLALAQALLKKEENQEDNKEENQEDNKEEDQEDNKEENQEDNKEENQEDNKEENQEDNKEENQEDNKEDNTEESPQQNDPEKELSKEEIEQILNALEREEKDVQEQIQEKKKIGIKGSILKDW